MTISYTEGTISVLRRWKGSVYKSILKQLVIYLLLWYFVRIIYFYVLSKNQQITFEHINKTLDSHMSNSFMLTFILGFYVNAIIKRWWDQIELIVWPDDIVSFTAFIFNDQEKNTKIKRHQVARYLVLCCCLVFRDLSTKVMKRFPTVDHLVNAGVMTEEECGLYNECGEESGRWMLPLEWISKILRQRMDGNNVAPPICAAYIGLLNKYRENLRRMYVYDWINIPLVYTQVTAIATYSYFCLTLITRQYLDYDQDHHHHIAEFELDMYFPIFTVFEFIFYVGWFKVGQELMKPWGEDDDDAELNFILDRHLQVAFALSDRSAAQNCPAPMEDKFWLKPTAQLPHTKQSRKISEHSPKRYVASENIDPSFMERTRKTVYKIKSMLSTVQEVEGDEECNNDAGPNAAKPSAVGGFKRPRLSF